MSVSEAYLERIANASEEQLKWTRFLGTSKLRELLEQILKTDEEKLVYELSDGERSTRDIEKLVTASRTKISTLWAKWHRLHIMERSDKYGGKRMRHVFSLTEVGMDVPSPSGPQAGPEPVKEEFD